MSQHQAISRPTGGEGGAKAEADRHLRSHFTDRVVQSLGQRAKIGSFHFGPAE